ncbi:MAG: hypothetical protein ACUVWO_16580 [Thermodesulfobacteriota bacterium]
MSENITTRKEFYEPLTELKWDTEGVTQAGATRTLVYRDKDSGTYCRILKFPEGFGEGKTEEENQHACCDHDFDEIVFIATGGVINRRLGYRYHVGSISKFLKGIGHGPLEAPFGCLLVEFRHYVERDRIVGKMTTEKEFLQPGIDLKWTKERVMEAGVESALVYHDKEGSGSYCHIVKLPEGFHEGRKEVEKENDYDAVIYIASGGLINRRLGYRYNPGTIGVIPKGTSYGPLEAPFGALLVEFCHYRGVKKL